jgi:hypothetical protein
MKNSFNQQPVKKQEHRFISNNQKFINMTTKKTSTEKKFSILHFPFSIALLLAVLVFASCKKNGGNDNGGNPSGKTVYVAGYTTSAGKTLCTVWKNGTQANDLTDETNNAAGNSVFMAGNDVYVAGTVYAAGKQSAAAVWKNGKIINTFTDGTYLADAYSVYVSGSDVYVAGDENKTQSSSPVAKVWKNGALLYPLGGGGTGQSTAQSIFVSGNDVYVAGVESGVTQTPAMNGWIAKVWKNGALLYVLPNINTAGAALSVYVSGSDVYVAGYERNAANTSMARVWKNGTVLYPLTNGTYAEYITSFFVSGGDLYGVVYELNAGGKRVAKLWKNGAEAAVLSNGTNDAAANAVYVSGSDVYIAGYDGVNAILWTNGTAKTLATNAKAGSVVVK